MSAFEWENRIWVRQRLKPSCRLLKSCRGRLQPPPVTKIKFHSPQTDFLLLEPFASLSHSLLYSQIGVQCAGFILSSWHINISSELPAASILGLYSCAVSIQNTSSESILLQKHHYKNKGFHDKLKVHVAKVETSLYQLWRFYFVFSA